MRSDGALLGAVLAIPAILAMPAMLVTLVLLPGCRDSRQDPGQAARSPDTAEWEWLQAAHKTLTEQRVQLARLPREAPAAVSLRKEVDSRTAELNRRLVDFINANAEAAAGDPPGDLQRAAIRMKSDEDLLLARQYIEQGGDYRRAIEIYETALAADPDNARLRQELATANARRYVTRERFAQVREGMSPDEVRRLLGTPNLQDVRAYPERGVTAWFYPKDASGAAAAVWFQKKAVGTAGTEVVYLLDFEAIQPPAAPPGPAGGG